MNRADRKLWASARTLDDLCELTAMWLEGELEQTPGHLSPPMPETAEITAELIAANRAGFLTAGSQPGRPLTPDGSRQHAAVTGFVPASRLGAVRAALDVAGLDYTEAGSTRWVTSYRTAVAVTFDRGLAFTSFGCRISRRGLRWEFGGCHRDAVREVCDAWQVTVIDKTAGRNDRLWPALASLASLAGEQVQR